MTPEISTPPETAVETYFHERDVTKTTPAFLRADEEVPRFLLQSLASSLSGGTFQPENAYYCLVLETQEWVNIDIK